MAEVSAKAREARQNLSALMEKHSRFGARDSEGLWAFDMTYDAGTIGKPFPLSGENPWELYESIPGWESASVELIKASREYWKALLEERLGVTISD